MLTVSSYPNRTSPVLRGKWILDNLLNAPPPPPPPNVPNLDDAATGQAASLRQQLEQHRKERLRLLPLADGSARPGSREFDAIGAWRIRTASSRWMLRARCPDGRSFNGPNELLTVLASERDAFTRGLTEKMLTYALGRGLERSDRAVVRDIARRVSEQNYRFSALVLEIVKSLPFQMRKVEPKS